MNQNLCLALVVALGSTGASAFAPPSVPRSALSTTTSLALGIPKFFLPKDEQQQEDGGDEQVSGTKKKDDKKLDAKGLLQLITAGAGAPFLGDFEGVDQETGKFMFSLEANNLVDEEGNSKQTSMPYFESGWVDENDTGFKWPWEKKD